MSIEILLVAIFTSVACSVIGVLLVLRKMAMLTDAISHTVLLGIVIVFIFVPDLSSPLLIIGATIMGLITVYLVELLVKTNKTHSDAATGVVFPLLFAISVIIINTFFKNTHLDIDAVLLGKIEFVVFDRWILFGTDMGPKSLYIMGFITILLITGITLFYKEIKLVIFDKALAVTLGISVTFIHYLIITGASLTAVAAFDVVGSILVVALMVGPAATALLYSKSLSKTLVYAVAIGIFNSTLGYFFAYYYDLSISGAISSMTLFVFLFAMLTAPSKGIISTLIRKNKQGKDFILLTLLFHIYNHHYNVQNIKRIPYELLSVELKWSETKLSTVFNNAVKHNYLLESNEEPTLTEEGVEYVKAKYYNYFKVVI